MSSVKCFVFASLLGNCSPIQKAFASWLHILSCGQADGGGRCVSQCSLTRSSAWAVLYTVLGRVLEQGLALEKPVCGPGLSPVPGTAGRRSAGPGVKSLAGWCAHCHQHRPGTCAHTVYTNSPKGTNSPAFSVHGTLWVSVNFLQYP